MRMHTKRVYIAARYDRFPEMRNVQTRLRNAGISCHCTWLNGQHAWEPTANKDEVPAEAVEFAHEDLRDLHAADTLIAFTDRPEKPKSRGGRHVEFGIALAMQKRIIVVGPRENIFYCLPQVEQFSHFDGVIHHLKQVPFHVEP